MMKRLIMVLATSVCLSVVLAEDIPIVGTGAGMGLMEAVVAEYLKANPQAGLTVPPSIGSGGGITAVGKDKAILGRVSRPLKDSEKEMGLSYLEFAKLPIVFYSHPSSGAKSLSQAQLIDIFEGKIDNWKAVGGADLPILLVRRNKGDSSLDVLQASMKGFAGENISTDATTQFTDQKALAYVTSKPGAIAFGTYADTAKSDVTTIAVDRVGPLDKGYPFLGSLALIYKDANLKGHIKGFVDFVSSAKAKTAISKAYGIPSR
jgi:phosphate transport system substrate-binding protein